MLVCEATYFIALLLHYVIVKFSFGLQALTGCLVDVPTLDGRLLSIPINDIVR